MLFPPKKGREGCGKSQRRLVHSTRYPFYITGTIALHHRVNRIHSIRAYNRMAGCGWNKHRLRREIDCVLNEIKSIDSFKGQSIEWIPELN